MPSFDSLVAFAALSFVLIAIPGPSVMFVVSRAVALGRRAALLTVVGNAAGVYLQVVMTALGLGVIVERSAFAFELVKVAGSAYLVWLGISAIRGRRTMSHAIDDTVTTSNGRSILLEGFVVGATNPKSIVFFSAILPQFVSQGTSSAGLQMGMLGLLFIGIALVSDSAWALAAGTARQWLASSRRRLELMGGAGGFAMVGLGIHLLLTSRSD